jgi:competence protein ComFC
MASPQRRESIRSLHLIRDHARKVKGPARGGFGLTNSGIALGSPLWQYSLKMGAWLQSLQDSVNAGLAFLYPETCQLCGVTRATVAQSFICADCRKGVRFIEPPICDRCGFPFQGAISQPFECANCRDANLQFSHARSAVFARETVLDVIHRYKYQRAFWFEPFLAELLISRAAPELARVEWDKIIPVPLHPTKQREREFNQAERLARHLSRATGVPLCTSLVRRVLATRTQTLLSREERRANVRGAFRIRGSQRLNGDRIVLVDDVLTTGATTSACAKTLLTAGASEVCVWTVARGV